MFRMARLVVAALALAFTPQLALWAQGNCPNCDLPPGCRGNGNQTSDPSCAPVAIQVDTDLDFGRIVLLGSGAGTVMLDLQTGDRITTGGLDQLGGLPMTGKVIINGAPMRVIRITFPTSVTMTDPAGGTATLDNFKTDLPAMPILDSAGQLEFTFTGTLHSDGLSGGDLRGRFPIRVAYD